MKVLFLTNIPVPYRIDFFNELGKKIDLTVVFDRKTATDRDTEWLNNNIRNFKAIFLKSVKFGNENAISFNVIKYLNNTYDYIIVGTHISYTALVAMFYMKVKGIKYIFNCDGGVFYSNENKIKKLLKKFFVKNAFCWLSTGEYTNTWLTYYGAKKDDICIYPFASFCKKYIVDKPINIVEKNQCKKCVGIANKFLIVTVGRFIDLKGFDVLIEAAQYLKDLDLMIYIIGGNKPLAKWLEIIDKYKLDNIRFINFQNSENLKVFYKAADIFVLPTRQDSWGLVVNEAMGNALPIITTDKCNAGLELIKNGENGFIVPAGDIKLLAYKIRFLYENNNIRFNMALNNLEKIKGYTIEKMVYRHLEILDILEKNK